MAEAIRKVRLKTTLVLKLIWKRFMKILLPLLLGTTAAYVVMFKKFYKI